MAAAIVSVAAQYGDDGPVDMIADKTDNVEVVVALDGSPIDDEDDIGNEIMYGEESRGVPLYINNYGKADHGGGQPQGLKERLPYEPSFGWVGRTNSRLVNGHSPLFEKRPGPGPYHSRNHGGVRPGPYRPPPPPPDHEEHNRQNQHNQIEENNHNEHRQDEYFDHNNDHYGDHEDERYSQDTFADHERDTLPGPEEFHYPTGRRNEASEHSDVDHDYVDVGFYGNQELEGGHAAYEFFEEDEEGEQRQGEGGYSPSAPSGPGFEERPPQDEAFGGGPSHHQGYESFQSDQLFDDGRRKGSEDLFLFSDPGSPPVDGFGNEVFYDTGDTNRGGDGFYEGFSR